MATLAAKGSKWKPLCERAWFTAVQLCTLSKASPLCPSSKTNISKTVHQAPSENAAHELQVAVRSLRLGQVLGQIDAPSSKFEVGEHVTASGDAAASLQLQITAVLNPLSSGAQRIAPVLDFLRSTLGPHIQVLLPFQGLLPYVSPYSSLFSFAGPFDPVPFYLAARWHVASVSVLPAFVQAEDGCQCQLHQHATRPLPGETRIFRLKWYELLLRCPGEAGRQI